MQGQRRVFDSFPETVDLNQESVSNNTSMDHPNAWNNVLNPVESRLSHIDRNISVWDFGESSSSANLQNQIPGNGVIIGNGWSPSFSACAGAETRLEERRFEHSNIVLHDSAANQVAWRPLSIQSSSSDRFPVNANLNARYTRNDDDARDGIEAGVFPSFYKSGSLDMEQIPFSRITSDDAGPSSGKSGYFVENGGGSSSPLGTWGLSCKRKSLEGTSAQSYPVGSTSCFPQVENIVQHDVPNPHNASGSLNISSPAVHSTSVSRSEQLNPRFGVGVRSVAAEAFTPFSVTGIAENSPRNFGPRVNQGHQERVPSNLASAGNSIRCSSSRSSQQSSRSISFTDSLESGSVTPLPTNSSNSSNQIRSLLGPDLTRNMPFPWNGALSSRPGTSSSSLVLPGERSVLSREEESFRSTIRNNAEHPMFVPVTETRNLVQDPTNWSLATGSSSASGGAASSSRVGSSSRPFPTGWIPHHNPPTQNQPRISDFAPWTLFPSVESEAAVPRGHFFPFPSGPSSPEETATSSGANSQGHHQPYQRSALLMDVPGNDVNGWRALAADIEGRQRLVSELRHVLSAMRRGESLPTEDYMLFDPFISGAAELHDRHRDMRLDVDNMSYEELLALEERIGNVNTGLSEETILQSMKQREHLLFTIGTPPDMEPCSICQEEYVSGDAIGTLDCGHDFHTNCVKQWLIQKNLCPICKMTALGT